MLFISAVAFLAVGGDTQANDNCLRWSVVKGAFSKEDFQDYSMKVQQCYNYLFIRGLDWIMKFVLGVGGSNAYSLLQS